MELIVALDLDNVFEAEALVDLLKNKVRIFKVGSKLFTAAGLAVIDMINRKKCSVFLDLKYHDIPTVVADAVRHAALKNVFSVSLHVSGGREMLELSSKVEKRPELWGITVLTSLDDQNLKELGFSGTVREQVELLAKLARDIGLDGVVSSAKELDIVKKIAGLKTIVPGIRLENDKREDQKRVLSPSEAKALGADYIVCGRPIITSVNPAAAAENILREIA